LGVVTDDGEEVCCLTAARTEEKAGTVGGKKGRREGDEGTVTAPLREEEGREEVSGLLSEWEDLERGRTMFAAAECRRGVGIVFRSLEVVVVLPSRRQSLARFRGMEEEEEQKGGKSGEESVWVG
jgi:hypothetical protein